MAEEKTNIKPISAETLAAIKRKSAYNLPDRPSERGMKPDEIKRAFWAPISDAANSTIAELERVISEANTVLDNLRGGISSLENTLKDNYYSNEEADKKTAEIIASTLETIGIYRLSVGELFANHADAKLKVQAVGDRYLVREYNTEYQQVNGYYSIYEVTGITGTPGTSYSTVSVKYIKGFGALGMLFYVRAARYVEYFASGAEGLYSIGKLDATFATKYVPRVENTTGSNAAYFVDKDGITKLVRISTDPNNYVVVMRSSGKDTFGNDDSGELRVRKKSQIDAGELMPKTDYVAICKAQADKLYASKTDLNKALGSYVTNMANLIGGEALAESGTE